MNEMFTKLLKNANSDHQKAIFVTELTILRIFDKEKPIFVIERIRVVWKVPKITPIFLDHNHSPFWKVPKVTPKFLDHNHSRQRACYTSSLAKTAGGLSCSLCLSSWCSFVQYPCSNTLDNVRFQTATLACLLSLADDPSQPRDTWYKRRDPVRRSLSYRR